MKKLIVYILAALATAVAATAFAEPQHQSKKIDPVAPDFERIKTDISNPSSPYYYPKLMERYERNETIMNLEEYRHLYYGYLFQEDFNPYRKNDILERNEALYYKNQHTRAELDSIITYANTALDDNPFDLNQMNFLIYALQARGKINLASIW